MKKNLITWVIFIVCTKINAQQIYFPPTSGTTWDTLSPAALGWCPTKINEMYNYLETNSSKAFLVLKNGKIVLEKYFGTFTRDSLWYWASAGKTLTSFTVGIAQQERFLNINDTSSRYLGQGWTSLTTDKEQKITIRNQLTMTTGLQDNVSEPDCTLPVCLRYSADAGARWAYHNAPYTLLDKVIENATRQTLNAYFGAKVRNVIGMNGAFLRLDYNNVYFSNARSMARFGLLIQNKGIWNTTPILSDTAFYNQMVNTSQQINKSYGYLWWLNGKPSYMVPTLQTVFNGSITSTAPADMFSAMGKNGQLLHIVPSQGLIVIRMGESPNAVAVPFLMANEIWTRINGLNDCATNTAEFGEANAFFKIYPNPTQNHLQIEPLSNDIRNYEISLYNSLGQRLGTWHDVTTLDLSNFSQNIYFVEIKFEDKRLFHKILKK